MSGGQRQRAFKSAAFQKLRAVTLDHSERASVSRHRGGSRQQAVQDQPFFRREAGDARVGQFSLDAGSHSTHRAFDALQIARRLLHKITVDRLEIRRRLLEPLSQSRFHALQGRNRERATPLARRVEPASLIATSNGGSDIGAYDLYHAVIRDHAPALDAGEK